MSTRLGMTSDPPEPEDELGACAGSSANLDRAVLLFHQPAGDVEAQPGPGAPGAAHAALEDAATNGPVDPRPAVDDVERHGVVAQRDTHVRRRAGGVLAHVVEQGCQHLRRAVRTPLDSD